MKNIPEPGEPDEAESDDGSREYCLQERKMRVLIFMHDAREDAGTIMDFLEQNQSDIHIVKFYEGDSLPENAFQYNTVISMGGPMNVYEETKYPFLKDETQFLACCLEKNIPVFGICLGAQLMAKAAGARVIKAPREETGWSDVTLTDEGRQDSFFSGLPESFPVFQLHGDTFEIPGDATLLATAPACRNQAFRIRNSLALQFHLEVQADKLGIWLTGHDLQDDVLSTYEKIRQDLDHNARRLYRNFFGEKNMP